MPEAARVLRRTPDTVHRWIREGAIHAVQVGSTKLIRRADLEALLATADEARAAADARKATGPLLSPEQLDVVRRAVDGALAALAEGREDPATHA